MIDRSRSESPEPEELRALLELRALPGIGDLKLAALLERYGTARRALAAPAEALGERAAAERGTARIHGWVERALETIARWGVAVLKRESAAYPAVLRELHDPPALLFALGRLELLGRPAVAVVGSRHPTVYGAQAAAMLAADLSRAGVVVVSGMARGIDGAAHAAALGGGTIGVLGCGIDVVYPPEQAPLYERVAGEGLLLSEFLPGEPPLPHHFPRRNRVIAALARGVLVVEATERSGAMATVRHALELGRDVYAVPGPIGRPTSAGTNRLIQEGAKLVTTAADVLEELGMAAAAPGGETSAPPGPPAGLAGDRLALWAALGDEPCHVDVIAAACGIRSEAALVALLDLELLGHARRLPGMQFVRA